MVYRGQVIEKRISDGSKSERDAVVLATGQEEFVLRRRAGNPFRDEELLGLVGATVEVEGLLHGYTLLIDSYRRV